MTRLLWFPIAALLTAGCSSGPSSVQTMVDKTAGNSFHVILKTTSKAAPAAVWKALTDYEHHEQWMPHLTQSQVVYRNAEYSVVEQRGKVHVAFWNWDIYAKQKVRETAPSMLQFQAVDGDFTQLEGDWRLDAMGEGTLLLCEFRLQPRRRVPGWAVKQAVSNGLAEMAVAIVRQAEQGR